MLEWAKPGDWEPATDIAAGRRAAGAAAEHAPSPFLARADVATIFETVETKTGTPRRADGARRAAPAPIALKATVSDSSQYLVAVRYPSGALRFVAPSNVKGNERSSLRRTAKRSPSRAKAATRTLLFEAPAGWSNTLEARRSLLPGVSEIVDAILIRVGKVVNDVAVGPAERTVWRLLDRKPGLRRVSKAGLASGALPLLDTTPVAGPNGRALLFLHGTFSATASAFGSLAKSNAFERLAAAYGDAIYGFDHYSVSVSPEENAKALLQVLAAAPTTFDVVTHSRGGLVLRNLVERVQALGADASRFRLGKAILVACPNEGTPLATPARISTAAEWVANLIDMTPVGTVVDAKAVALWISWFARVAVASAPGLAAMDADSSVLGELQRPPGPADDSYAALVANYVPDDRLWARILDLGIDLFFQGANDLVVPTTGGWRVDRLEAAIPGKRVGCFGPGGNIDDQNKPVSHISFFERQETADFITQVLRNEPISLPPMELDRMLPSHRQRRALAALAAAAGREPPAAVEMPQPAPARPAATEGPATVRPAKPEDVRVAGSALNYAASLPNQLDLMVISGEIERVRTGTELPGIEDEVTSVPLLLATYRGARVSVPFRLRKQDVAERTSNVANPYERAKVTQPNIRWNELIKMHQRLKRYVDGAEGATLPDEHELRRFGDTLFETLLPGNVRRLFDVARASGEDRMVVIFTSMIDWVSDIPWEFARDPNRETFLATEDVHFLRNILTPIPIERAPPLQDSLRMLIATAEPNGLELPAAEREASRIKDDLKNLVEKRRMSIDVLEHATPASLHHRLVTGRYDIVHFIGHGYWNRGVSGLVLEDETGGQFDLDERSLREMFAGRGLRVVFLNACDTGRGVTASSRPYSIGGTAQSLFGRGIPVVVANQLKVRDLAAADFASQFYRYLAHGLTIAEATREARIAASYAVRRESIDWAIPVVYARNAGGALVRA